LGIIPPLQEELVPCCAHQSSTQRLSAGTHAWRIGQMTPRGSSSAFNCGTVDRPLDFVATGHDKHRI
jgi:hypothetical protein